MSDLHGYLPKVDPCELVLICGDIVPLNVQEKFMYTYKWFSTIFKEWAENLPCQKVLFIAGNHELHFPSHYDKYKDLFPNDSKVTYLCHEQYNYIGSDGNEYSIFGTPYCEEFGDWAFMLPGKQLGEKFLEIPEKLDVLLTHDQPRMFGDILLQEDCPWATGEHIGNSVLTLAILAMSPKYQFNGHLHSCDHNQIMIGDTVHYNVSLKDESYQVAYNPLYLEIDK